MLEVNEAEFDRIYTVNVKSIYQMTQATMPPLRPPAAARMINIGSTAGVRPRPGLTWYNGSKGAVDLVSNSMAVDGAPEIRVNCIAPVMGETGLTEDFWAARDAGTACEVIARFRSAACRGPPISPRPVYLASDEADFITGVVLPVDGGRTI